MHQAQTHGLLIKTMLRADAMLYACMHALTRNAQMQKYTKLDTIVDETLIFVRRTTNK